MGEIRTGPPLPGAPWLHRVELTLTYGPPGPAKVPDADAPRIAPEVRSGPPIPGAPWFRHAAAEEPWTLGKAVLAGTPGGARLPQLPLLPRVPPNADARRLSRLTDEISTMLNCLIRSGQIVQVGQTWAIVTSAAAPVATAASGLTGTFP